MKIEVLYVEGCPNYRRAVERAQEVLKEEGLTEEVVEVNVRDEAAARSLGFLGSPTIRVSGLDIEPAARSSKNYGTTCRTYTDSGRREGVPSRELIRRALQDAAEEASAAHDCCRVPAAPASSPRPADAKPRVLLGASVIAAVGASLCCILPIVAAVSGLGVFAAGVSFENWRPYLLGLTGTLLAAGFILAYRDHKRACVPDSLCATRPMNRWNAFALGFVAVVVLALAAFPYYSGTVAQAVAPQVRPSISAGSTSFVTATFWVPDMSCPACATSLTTSFKQLPGVADAKVDFDSRKAVVSYDPSKQNFAAFEKVVTDVGYHVELKPRS
jgi:mercuric ion transport protein